MIEIIYLVNSLSQYSLQDHSDPGRTLTCSKDKLIDALKNPTVMLLLLPSG